MKTVTQKAKEIRDELKKHGITSKQVSVRSESFSMGSSIDCLIKDISIDPELVRSIAEKQEHIRRDGEGDILTGGNRFVSVSYDWQCQQNVGNSDKANRLKQFIEATLSELSEGQGQPIGSNFCVFKGNHKGEYRFTTDENPCYQRTYGIQGLVFEALCKEAQGKTTLSLSDEVTA